MGIYLSTSTSFHVAPRTQQSNSSCQSKLSLDLFRITSSEIETIKKKKEKLYN